MKASLLIALLVSTVAAGCSENKPAATSEIRDTAITIVPDRTVTPDTSLPADTPVVNGDLSP